MFKNLKRKVLYIMIPTKIFVWDNDSTDHTKHTTFAHVNWNRVICV